MRRLIPLAALLACAQPGMPPGGPPDVAAPRLVRIRPDTNARNVRDGRITFVFDEVVSEKPRSGNSLADIVTISPSKGTPNVSWHRTTLIVSPRGGLRLNTTYTVRLAPGVTDLANNTDSIGHTLVFSTGSTIATGAIRGVAFDWAAAKPAAQAVIEVLSLPDSAAYTTVADSSGRFELLHVAPGKYLFRGYVDQNRNRLLDPRELFDSATVTLGDSLRREVLAIVRDSLGPGLASVDLRDSVTLRVTLDRHLDTTLVITPALFSLKASDSAVVEIRSATTQAELDRLAADSVQRKRQQDSLRQARSADSARRADSLRTGVAPARPTGRRPGVPAGPAPARADSARGPLRPSARIPIAEVILKLARPLAPATSFRLHGQDLRSVTGATRSSDRVFTTPKPKADTTAVKKPPGADTTKVKKPPGEDTTKVKKPPGEDTTKVRKRPGAFLRD